MLDLAIGAMGTAGALVGGVGSGMARTDAGRVGWVLGTVAVVGIVALTLVSQFG